MYSSGDLLYLTVRDRFARGDNLGVTEPLQNLARPWPAGVSFYAVAALINLEETAQARRLLATALAEVADPERADLLALEGLLAAQRGDTETYLSRAVEANRLHTSAHTLYHLGMASAHPEGRLRMLQASLIEAEGTGDRYAEARSAGALAPATAALGRLKEALGWAQFALDRTAHPGLQLVALNARALLEVLSGDTAGLEAALVAAQDADGGTYPRQRTQLRTTLADLYQATGRYAEAGAIYAAELHRAPRALRSWLVHGYVRSLTALGRQAEAAGEAQAAAVVTHELSEYHRQTASLALGIALWPAAGALEPLTAAFDYFSDKDAVSAAEAAFYLDALAPQGERLVRAGRIIADITPQLTATGLHLLAGRTLTLRRASATELPPLQVFTLGKAEAYLSGRPVRTRRRSLELLTLLLSRPRGLEAEALSEGLYGADQGAALRVELHRLRKELNVAVSARPYRVTSPVWTDLSELDRLLQEGRVRDAVSLYRGPLLPNSEAPGVAELRNLAEAELRSAVLATGDAEAIWELAQIMPFDLELWETLTEQLSQEDPRRRVAAGKSARVRLELDL